MTFVQLWPQCLLTLQQDLSAQQYNMWIAPLTVGEENGERVVFAPHAFGFNYIRQHFWDKIQAAANQTASDNEKPLVLKIGKGKAITAEIAPPQPALSVNGLPEKTSTIKTASHTKEKPQPHKAAKRNESALDIVAKRMGELGSKPSSADLAELSAKPAKTTEEVSDKSDGSDKSHKEKEKNEAQLKRYIDTNLNPDHTFAALVQGKGNRMAYAAAVSIAEAPGNPMYNPFFVYGSTGLGKTHLVQAIGNQLFKLKPKTRIRYIHADEFIRGIMSAFQAKSFEVMRTQYQQFDLLILDDVQFIAGKDRTMEEFFYVYNHLIDAKKQVILTCDTMPTHIDGMDDRLKSRFSWGLTVELEPPELEMRVAILQKKAEISAVKLKDEAAFFIAKHIRSNVRELEGAFKRVAAQSRFAKRPIDVGLATEALQDILNSHHKPMTLENIQSTVAKYYGVSVSDIMSKKRTRNIVRPRQMAMKLAKELTSLSLPAIGVGFGGRDHTTVMHATKSIDKLRQTDTETEKAYDILIKILRN
ncbi:chromosomal replication initiator protein DnaA [Stenoxybacter acetivorans]|uniref:chromosomal replication initiator protein DnaA n=1 Tax=Stenoxybacter acetivorans TaxID=422441 RepID=UPI000567E756|nr:chromosomal replication initiator protein DnaA [Stenoxybacter acetivorans]